MTSNQMSEAVARFFVEANNLQWRKNRDYHPDNVAFLEIVRTAYETGISVEQDLWAKIRKQYIALRSYMIDGKLESEPPRQRMIDIAVYMGMVAFWEQNKTTVMRDAYIYMDTRTTCETPHELMDSNLRCSKCDRCLFTTWLAKRVTQI